VKTVEKTLNEKATAVRLFNCNITQSQPSKQYFEGDSRKIDTSSIIAGIHIWEGRNDQRGRFEKLFQVKSKGHPCISSVHFTKLKQEGGVRSWKYGHRFAATMESDRFATVMNQRRDCSP